MRLELKTKIALVVSALMLLVIGVGGSLMHGRLTRDYLEVLRQQQDGLVRAMADAVAADINQRIRVLEHSAMAVDAQTLAQAEARQRFLERGAGARPLFDSLALADAGGMMLASEPPQRLVNVADREYFKQMLATRRTVVSPPLLLRADNQPGVVIGAPLFDAQGAVIGSLGGVLSLRRPELLRQLRDERLGRSGFFCVRTSGPKPVYLVHPDPAKLLMPAVDNINDSDGDNDDAALERGLESGDVRFVVTRAPVRGLDWEVEAVLPADEALAPLRASQRRLRFGMAVLALASGAIVWIATRRLMRPLAALHGAVALLRDDPARPVRLEQQSNDEVGDLSRDVGALVRRLGEQRAELAAAQEAERTLVGIFEATTDFVIQSDSGGALLYVNPAARRLAGLGADAVLTGRRVADFVPPWVAEQMVDLIIPAAQKHGVWLGDTAVYDAWRREIPVSHLVIAHRAPDGALSHYSSILRDVSEARRTERALRDSEQRLRTITDNMPALISYLDSSQRFQFANAAYSEWLGLDPQRMTGRTLREVYGDAVHGRIRGYIEMALGGVPVSYEREFARAGRPPRQAHVDIVPHRDESGAVAGLYVLIHDVTGPREVEQALRRSEERLRNLTDALPVSVALIDAEERVRYNNVAYEQRFGLPRDGAQGRIMRDVLGAAHYAEVEAHVRRALAGERIVFEAESSTPQGPRVEVATYIPEFAADGSIVQGFIAVRVDVTAQKSEERRLLQLSQRDTLTGLMNRSGFEQRLAEAMARTRASSTPMALFYLDIDYFKRINDTHGHPAGDLLLKQFAQRLESTLRASDVVTRLGGDEFTVILENLVSPADADRLAGNLIEAVREPFVIDGVDGGQPLLVTTSLGVAFYRADPVIALDSLIQRADVCLYAAKSQGRDRHCTEV